MYDLFISYATDDGLSLAKAVAAMLHEVYMLETFIADEESRVGTSLNEKVRKAMLQSQQVLVLFTKKAVASDWVNGEVTLAIALEKDIIICRSQDVQRQALPILLLEKEHLDFQDSAELLEKLKTIQAWGIPLIIPAAGRSGGLYPLNMGMPKILLPIGKKPILHHIIDKLDSTIFSKIIILTKDFSEMIEYYAGLSTTTIPIECRRTPAPLLPLALKEMKLNTTFMVHYSDILIEDDFYWAKFLQHHKYYRSSQNVIGTLLTSNRYKLPVGRVKTGQQQIIREFTEKPESIEAIGYTINMAQNSLDTLTTTTRACTGTALKGQWTLKRIDFVHIVMRSGVIFKH
ncbi:MAG: TIR domain-containing protein [Acidobacteria bacterium]|nr:TIR domain-containing protein [Acidobacteriota bacterium]